MAEELKVAGCNENDLYGALDWLLERQKRIEKKLAVRHLEAGGYGLYDVSSRCFEGRHCPLAVFGHNKDGKHGKRSLPISEAYSLSPARIASALFLSPAL